jgi:hypothetical protein
MPFGQQQRIMARMLHPPVAEVFSEFANKQQTSSEVTQLAITKSA